VLSASDGMTFYIIISLSFISCLSRPASINPRILIPDTSPGPHLAAGIAF